MSIVYVDLAFSYYRDVSTFNNELEIVNDVHVTDVSFILNT